MKSVPPEKLLLWAGIIFGACLAAQYILPLVLPFLLGLILALAAEPAVKRMTGPLRRGQAAGLGVALTIILLCSVLSVIGGFAVKQVSILVKELPDMGQTVQQGLVVVQDWLVGLADRAPEPLRPALTQTVLTALNDSSALVSGITEKIPGAVTAAVGTISDGALTLGTGIVAGFLISARLPRLRSTLTCHIPDSWKETYIPAMRQMRHALAGWLKAQLKLMSITAGVLTVGFFALGIRFSPLWAVLIALVDAVPILGTGTVLLPWALVCFLQQNTMRGVWLLALYGITALVRAVLEPRLVGRHLGLDPLLTLGAFYAGYRLWGFAGMVLAPLLVAALSSVLRVQR